MRAQPYERYPATCVRLLKWIRAFAETNTSDRLPSEENIAGQLGVSRVKIRDVLSQLEAAGYVTRKRGVGTLINRYVLAEAARLDIDSSYVDIVASYGYTPRATLRKLKLLSPASPILAEKLRIDPADGVYLFEKVVYADERPVIVVEDYIPAPLYDQSNCDLALMDTNIYFFLQSMCDELLQTATVHLDACLPTGYLAQSMDVPEDFPLVTLRSLFYTQSSTPILYSEEYYNTKLIPFSFQKRILTGKFNREQPPIELL